MAQIFISYSRSDKNFINQFIPLISKKYGRDFLWFDEEILGGIRWWEKILDEIAKCKIFIYLISTESLESRYCQAELQEALRLNKQILPVVIRRLIPKYPGTIRADLAEVLRSRQFIDMSQKINDSFATTKLYLSLDSLLESVPLQVQSFVLETRTPEPRVLDKPRRMIIPLLISTIITASLLFVFLQNQFPEFTGIPTENSVVEETEDIVVSEFVATPTENNVVEPTETAATSDPTDVPQVFLTEQTGVVATPWIVDVPRTLNNLELRVLFNLTSLTIIVEDNENNLGQMILLRDFGFSYLNNDDTQYAKLSDYLGFEVAFDRVELGTCITITIEATRPIQPGRCGENIIYIYIHPADRFWYDSDTSNFRPIIFFNTLTDQQCVISNFECFIRFEQDIGMMVSGEIHASGVPNAEIETIMTVSFGEDITDLVLEVNGKSTVARQSDCFSTAFPNNFSETEITVFAFCDDTATNAEFLIHNPLGVAIEWAIWRVSPQYLLHESQTVEFSIYFSQTSLVIVVENVENALEQSVSLHEFGFSYLYNGQLVNTKLSRFGGFESDIGVVRGRCIKIHVPDDRTPLPRRCGDNQVAVTIIVHPVDRFWYDIETSSFRLITFSNAFTDQQCVIRNFECTLQFERNAGQAESGEISRQDEPTPEVELLATVSFGEDATSFVLEANGKSAIARQSDCSTLSPPANLPETEITVYAVCDDTATNAQFFINNPAGDAIEWVVWRVLPNEELEIPITTAIPDPNFELGIITGDISVEQSNIRTGPGTDFPPDAVFPYIQEGTRIELIGQYVNLDTRQLWYEGTLDGRTVWVFANNIRVNDGQANNLPLVNIDTVPELPQLLDEDADGIPDIEDVCLGDVNASRRSECAYELSGINNNRDVVNPQTPVP